jgi:peroxiredoxin
MAALQPGTAAPDIALTGLDGKPFILSEVRKRGPIVLAFFKVGCPTCQYTFPYLERLWQAHKTEPLTIVGISQDDQKDTEAFRAKHGVTFPLVLDDPARYRASRDYGLTNVPSIFLIDREGKIDFTSIGWVRFEFEQLNALLTMKDAAQKLPPIFAPGEVVAEFKAG